MGKITRRGLCEQLLALAAFLVLAQGCIQLERGGGCGLNPFCQPSPDCRNGLLSSISYSPDGRYLAVSETTSACIFYAKNRSFVNKIPAENVAAQPFTDFVWLPGSTHIATVQTYDCPYNQTCLNSWNVESGSLTNSLPLSRYAVFDSVFFEYLPDGIHLEVSYIPRGMEGVTHIVDLQRWVVEETVHSPPYPFSFADYPAGGPRRDFLAFARSNSGRQFVGYDWPNSSLVFYSSSSAKPPVLSEVYETGFDLKGIFGFGGARSMSIEFSPNDRFIALGGDILVSGCPSTNDSAPCTQGYITIFDTATKEVVFKNRGGEGRHSLSHFDWSPDGKTLVYFFDGDTIADLKSVDVSG